METCTENQSRYVRRLVSELGWTDFVYRNWLDAYYKVGDCRELNKEKASSLIMDLEGILNNQRTPTGEKMITKKQANYLKLLWLDVDYSKGDSGDKHLSAFLEKQFGVKSVYDLSCKDAISCIRMVKALIEQAKVRAGETTVLSRKGVCKYCHQPIMWVQLEDGRRVPFDFDSNDKATDFHECTAYKRYAANS